MESNSNLRNLYFVGRNYTQHAAELGNAVPEQPLIFTKPTHAQAKLEGEITLPFDRGAVHYEGEVVVRIGQSYEPGEPWSEMVDAFALGIDLTLRDVQTELKEKGHPWLAAKGFKQSAVLSPFVSLLSLSSHDELLETPFFLHVNGVQRQEGRLGETIFSLQQIVDFIGQHYGLDQGDVIFTGTPAGVGALKEQDEIELFWGETSAGRCKVIAAP
ncbi:fumarylacetoacetate hydrolase family protein [Marinicrinis sediminis]|uniref:Fumarylacetoacetate hydrolase family protein n=1 Tax=Marinicrinis sediminis TaxID=1652465 RepID=A0ABW5R7V9_9BACL